MQLRPVALVLDDAHAAVERIRDAFTIRFKGDSPIYQFLLELTKDSLQEQYPGKAESILKGDPLAIAEIPYWTWHDNLGRITKELAAQSETNQLKFTWNYVRDDLASMRCVIGGKSVEIFPDVANLAVVEAYAKSEHRVFMSATLANDSVLVKGLDCSPNAARTPLVPRSDRGVGERMILVPTLFGKHLERKAIQRWLSRLSRRYNVVVLAPSSARAATWTRAGACAPERDQVSKVLAELRRKDTTFVAFANRYDGIDLPDDMCRVLVIDGLPRAESITDAWEREVSPDSSSFNSRQAHRVEQGIGRAIRSPSDYAVAILLGDDLEAFVARSDVLKAMGPETQSQVRLAHELVELAQQEDDGTPLEVLRKLASQCLKRDDGWKEFYWQRIASDSSKDGAEGGLASGTHIAMAERKALRQFLDGDWHAASGTLVRAADEGNVEKADKARLFQCAARYVYPADPARGPELQKKARQWNSRLLKPPGGTKYLKDSSSSVREADIILPWLRQFEHPNAAIAAFRSLRDRMQFTSDSETFEEAIRELGVIVGAVASRPERDYGEGPDDLWVFPGRVFVIEAKNESTAQFVSKSDVGQLFSSRQWAQDRHSGSDCIPIICHRQDQAASGASPSPDMRVGTPDSLDQLLKDLHRFVLELTNLGTTKMTRGQVAALLSKHGLSSQSLANKLSKPLRASARRNRRKSLI